MARVGLSCVKAFRYSVESIFKLEKLKQRQLLFWNFAMNHSQEDNYIILETYGLTLSTPFRG